MTAARPPRRPQHQSRRQRRPPLRLATGRGRMEVLSVEIGDQTGTAGTPLPHTSANKEQVKLSFSMVQVQFPWSIHNAKH